MVRQSRKGVIPVLVTGIHLTACAGARGWLDAGDKPRHDNVQDISSTSPQQELIGARHAILVDKSTEVICQGFTGSQEIVPADNLANAVRRITDEVKKAA